MTGLEDCDRLGEVALETMTADEVEVPDEEDDDSDMAEGVTTSPREEVAERTSS